MTALISTTSVTRQTRGLCLIAAMLVLGSFTLTAQTATKKPPAKSTSSAKTKEAVPAVNPVAILHTSAGDMKCELFPAQAPKAVANFIGLAKGTKDWKDPLSGKTVHGKPLYDGVIFHRTIPEFMIQGGDPSGTGSGDVGFTFEDELHADLLFDRPGRLALANRGPNTNSSQFFVTEKELSFLNPCLDEGGCPQLRRAKGTGYTIFGQCDDASVELVKKIARMPCSGGVTCSNNNSRPLEPVKIKHVEIVGSHPNVPSPAKKHSTTPAPAPSPKP